MPPRRLRRAPTCSDIDECATNNGGCGSATYYKCANEAGLHPTCSDVGCTSDAGIALGPNAPCGANMCAKSKTVPLMLPGFNFAAPCCLDAANGICGSIQTADMTCQAHATNAPKR